MRRKAKARARATMVESDFSGIYLGFDEHEHEEGNEVEGYSTQMVGAARSLWG